jgi:DNA-3-methyladenine glycosylase
VLDESFFDQPSVALARALIGTTLLIDGVGGIVVETEAYRPDDPASHSYAGPTARNAAMFGPAGRAYVYRSYGIHWCLNVVGHSGSAVLLRALEPTAGLDRMRDRRGVAAPRALCSGPGKLCQALGVTREHDGARLDRPPFQMLPGTGAAELVVGPRIGITKAVEQPWRFGLKGSPYVSRRFPGSSPA